MKAKIDCILDFLKDVAAHNDRGWFAEHKGQYEEARTFRGDGAGAYPSYRDI